MSEPDFEREATKLKSLEARKASVLLGKPEFRNVAETLETEFNRSEEERQQVEQRKLLKQRGLPSVEEQKLLDLNELRQVFADRLEAQAFKRVASLMDLTQVTVDVKEKLTHFEFTTDVQTEKFEENTVLLRDINSRLEKMIQMLTQEISDNRTQRNLESETLNKLNQYLNDWV